AIAGKLGPPAPSPIVRFYRAGARASHPDRDKAPVRFDRDRRARAEPIEDAPDPWPRRLDRWLDGQPITQPPAPGGAVRGNAAGGGKARGDADEIQPAADALRQRVIHGGPVPEIGEVARAPAVAPGHSHRAGRGPH